MKEVITFKKQRELGDIITDTFKFVRQEWRDLGGMILKNTAVSLLVLAGGYIYFIQSTFGDIERVFTAESLLSNAILSILIIVGAMISFYALLYSTVLFYIKSYIANNGTVNPEEVSERVRRGFWNLIGLYILVAIIIFAGFVLCFLPGVYLGICLSLAFPIIVFEKNDIGSAISNSFKLIKNEWWMTFASIIVIYILYAVMTLIFQIPQFIYFIFKDFVTGTQYSGNPSDFIDWVGITINIIAMAAQYILFALVIIALAFIYYHLNEKKNHSGTIEIIDSLGEREH